MNWKRVEIVLEFLIFGIVVGVFEDLVAVKAATGESISWKTVGIIVIIAIPFAFLGEVVADQIDFSKILERIFSKKRKSSG